MCVHYKGKSKKEKRKGEKGKQEALQTPEPIVDQPIQPIKTPQAVAPSDLKGSTGKKKRTRKDEDSDNTLTGLPPNMPDMELEEFEYRQQLILDEHLM